MTGLTQLIGIIDPGSDMSRQTCHGTRIWGAGEKRRLTNNYSMPTGLDTFWSILTNIRMFRQELAVWSKEAYSIEQHDIPGQWEQ